MTTPTKPNSSCSAFDADLHDLLVGDLEPQARLQLEKHLSTCSTCRIALEEARQGLMAIENLADPPLPYEDSIAQVATELDPASTESDRYRQESWQAFKGRLQPPEPRQGDPWGIRLLSAAALLLLGIGLGVQLGSQRTQPVNVAETLVEQAPEPESIASLARVELLADVGLGYTQGLQDLLDHMGGLEAEHATPSELEATREIARDLVRDGRLLRRSLDPERDRVLLAAVNRAELVLEEIAAVGSSGLGAPASSVQLAVNDDVLRSQLTSVRIERRPEKSDERPRRAVTTFPREEGTSP